MIVLDEQLLGRGIEIAIAAWYPGAVCYITDLRPGTIIKDDTIPTLLNQSADPIFVTINETDFWRRIAITNRFSVVCISVPDSRAGEVPALLQRLLRLLGFQTKGQRSGRVVRLTSETASFYSATDAMVRAVHGW
jgi:hypothetical protein